MSTRTSGGQVSDARVELDMCLFKYTHTQQCQAAKWRIEGFRQLTMPGTVLSTVGGHHVEGR